MAIEIAESSNTGTVVTQNATGGRGIERITRGSTVVYPVYDAHGNQVGDISKNGTGYSLNDLRTFDAWGSVRSGNGSGDPKQGYCASLGHLKDDESGLTYMRARYYEPTTGRFVSEDPAMQGTNWAVYGGNNPIENIDRSGSEWESYLTVLYKDFKKALDLWRSAQANNYLRETNIRRIKDIINKIRNTGNVAANLGEDIVDMSTMTAEDADSKGALAGLGVDMASAQAAAGVGTISVKAVAAILIRELETMLLLGF